jgi:hypothetical protein
LSTPSSVIVLPDEIWFNDGPGNFRDSGQRLANNVTRAVFLSDLDGDGDLDLFVAGVTSGQVWFNDGSGRFTAGQRIRYGQYDAVALGDVTGDGRIEVLVAGVNFYRIWR